MDAYAQELIRLESLDQLRFEQQILKKKILPFLILMLVFAVGGILSVFYLVPRNPFISWVLIGIMVLLAIAIKPLTEKMNDIRHQIQELQ